MPYTVERVPATLPPQITSLNRMFEDASAFNGNISSWDTSQVTNMSYMFYYAEAFNQNISKNISRWDTSNVTDMSSMFSGAKAFNQNLKNWNVDKVTDHSNFDTDSGFAGDSSKLPNFK